MMSKAMPQNWLQLRSRPESRYQPAPQLDHPQDTGDDRAGGGANWCRVKNAFRAFSRRSLSLAFLATATTAATSHAATPEAPAAHVTTGDIAGTPEGDVLAFRGIPYAAPPVGHGRWRAPAPAPAWQGVRDATRFGAACPQAPDHKEAWARVGTTSEDCLFLNVWRPAAPGKYPVMVFIHGGGFTYGTAGVPLYDGARLARHGVVVITLNYRLGLLGFFAHPALTREDPDALLGNYGIMDQIAALRWVQSNAAAFGGDAGNVTVFGESAGAGSIQLLMGSPLAQGLFRKAISQSGAGGTILPSLQATEALTKSLTDKVGLRNVTADQLRQLPVSKLLLRSFPFVDGRVVVASPGTPFHRRQQSRIPLLIGGNSNEATLFPGSEAAARKELGAAYDGFLAAYRADDALQDGRREVAAKIDSKIDLAEDALMVLPSFSIAALHAAAGNPTWIYYFDQLPGDRRAGSAGTPHGGELEYLFGNPDEGSTWDEADRKVSNAMAGYWTRFARDGDPNGARPDGDRAPPWPRAGGDAPLPYLHIGTPTAGETLSPAREAVRIELLAHAKAEWEQEK
jgi:para-nitrobenzyl esterase